MNDDTISRQAAIDALKVIPDHNDGMVFEALSHALRDIETLPSAQPEQKIGRWIRMYYSRPKQYTRICSECREISWFCGIGDYNYCPWCGARMEGEEDDGEM